MALTVLTAAAIALSASARLELRTARRGLEGVQRDATLRGAVNRGLALLEGGRTQPAALRSALRQYHDLRWTSFTPPSSPDEPPVQIAVQLLDASARRDLNSVDADQLQNLGVPKEAAQAIISWRNEKSRDDYSTQPRPYEPRRRPFDTLEELLLVKNVDAGQFFGSVTVQPGQKQIPLSELLSPFSGENNADASGHPRANVNKADENTLLEAANRTGPMVTPVQVMSLVTNREMSALTQMLSGKKSGGPAYSSVAQALKQCGAEQKNWGALLDAWTTDTRSFLPGKVNVNTASPRVLRTLPGINADTVSVILKKRREKPAGLDWSDIKDLANDDGLGGQQQIDNFVSSLSGQISADLSDNTSLEFQLGFQQQRLTLDQLEKLFSIRSSVFLVRCLVREPGSSRIDAVQAVVYWPADPSEPAKIVQWRQPDRYPGWSAWYRPVGEEEGAESDR